MFNFIELAFAEMGKQWRVKTLYFQKPELIGIVFIVLYLCIKKEIYIKIISIIILSIILCVYCIAHMAIFKPSGQLGFLNGKEKSGKDNEEDDFIAALNIWLRLRFRHSDRHPQTGHSSFIYLFTQSHPLSCISSKCCFRFLFGLWRQRSMVSRKVLSKH